MLTVKIPKEHLAIMSNVWDRLAEADLVQSASVVKKGDNWFKLSTRGSKLSRLDPADIAILERQHQSGIKLELSLDDYSEIQYHSVRPGFDGDGARVALHQVVRDLVGQAHYDEWVVE